MVFFKDIPALRAIFFVIVVLVASCGDRKDVVFQTEEVVVPLGYNLHGVGELMCKQNLVDVGEVMAGTVLKHKFVLYNRGPMTVQISKTGPLEDHCSVELSKKEIGHRDSVMVKMVVDTKNIAKGAHSAMVVLETDGRNMDIPLEVLFQIKN